MFYICSNQNKGAYTMSYQPQFPGMFDPDNGAVPAHTEVSARDARAALPPTEKQMHYATSLSLKTGAPVPKRALTDRAALSEWIDAHKPKPVEGPFSQYPSSKQVAFAERIARLKRRDIPQECFRDKTMMSRWIDGNKPR